MNRLLMLMMLVTIIFFVCEFQVLELSLERNWILSTILSYVVSCVL